MSSVAPDVSVVIPYHGAPGQLRRCLDALDGSTLRPSEIVLVDDASPGGITDDILRRVHAATRLPKRSGPGAGRNAGSALARGQILFFIDADVLVHPDTIERGVRGLLDDPGASALIGSYDDEPPEPNFFSQFKNLLHHYVHHNSRREASSFWGGCGVIRKSAFDAMGGFDAERYPDASVEDIELGYRLKAAGHRILLDPSVQVTHLKRWTFRGMLRADILMRAVPWSDLILRSGGAINDLNIRVADRVSAASCGLAAVSLVLAPLEPRLLLAAVACAAVNAVLSRRLYLFFLRKRGAFFALRAVPLHMLYLLYSAATFALRALRHAAARPGAVTAGRRA